MGRPIKNPQARGGAIFERQGKMYVRYALMGCETTNGHWRHLGTCYTPEEAGLALEAWLERGEVPPRRRKGVKPGFAKLADGTYSSDPQKVAAARGLILTDRKRLALKPVKTPRAPRVCQPGIPKPAEPKPQRNERPFATAADWKRLYQERYAA